MTERRIEPGQHYWIELEGIRIKVRIVAPCSFLPGWWSCTSGRSGAELIVPKKAIKDPISGEGSDAD